VALLRERLRAEGESEVYERAGALLSARIASLEREGVDVQGEVAQLRRLRESVGERCLNMTHLERYRKEVQRRGFPPHPSQNKLRDYEEVYVPHLFSLNGEIFSSLDLCAPCEGAALLLSGGRGGWPHPTTSASHGAANSQIHNLRPAWRARLNTRLGTKPLSAVVHRGSSEAPTAQAVIFFCPKLIKGILAEPLTQAPRLHQMQHLKRLQQLQFRAVVAKSTTFTQLTIRGRSPGSAQGCRNAAPRCPTFT
jgi:hypothetical protein